MKRILTILLLFPALAVYTQDNSHILSDSVSRIETFSLNQFNDTIGKNIWIMNNTIVEWYYLSCEKGTWTPENKSQRIFDEKGNLISNLYLVCKNGMWVNRYLDLYTYDDQGHKTESINMEYKNKKWITFDGERTNYSYENNRLKEISYELWNRDGWIKDWRTEFVYKENKLICCYEYQNVENEWKVVYKNDYDWYKWYGSAGNSVVRHMNTSQEMNGSWINVNRPHSKRNASNIILYN